MKKIVYIHHGDLNGGAPRSLRFLIDRLDKTQYEPIVVHRKNEQDAVFFEEVGARTIYEPQIRPFHGSTVVRIDTKQVIYNFVYAIPTYFAAKRIFQKEKPDIVHLNSTCLFMCAKAAKAANRDIKVICHIREPLQKNIWGQILKYMNNKYCDEFIAIDQYDATTVQCQDTKIDIIYNFVDFRVYNSLVVSDVLRKELNLKKDDKIYLVLARLSPSNGCLEIIQQWKKLPNNQKNHLVVVGEIPGTEEKYSNICHKEASGQDNIHILKFRKDVVEVIASSDVVVCPFTEPHFARAIIEGAAMGKPSLVVDVDGAKELVVQNITGFIYNDTGSLAHYIELISSDDKLREELGTAAEKYALKNFNADINAERTFSHYKLG